MSVSGCHNRLEQLYARFNRPDYIAPDPLQFVHGYANAADREIVGLLAASLAFGNVKQIIRSIARVLAVMPEPRRFVEAASRSCLDELLSSFRHRFVTGRDVAGLLWGIRRMIEIHGSLEYGFRAGMHEGDETTLPALERFVGGLRAGGDTGETYLLPLPSRGSACKRLHLYLRWMVRKDAVDPGGWTCLAPSMLLYPVDTHMHRIGREMGFTRRRNADLRTALEITSGFRRFAPGDPVRYDFALTRTGIRPDARPWQSWIARGGSEPG